MNLFDLSSTNRETYALKSTGGWVGTLPDGYTTTVDGKKFIVRLLDWGGQSLIHKLPGGGEIDIRCTGSISWYNDHGKLHREDGPAVTQADGSAEWWTDGKRHREDGPAVTWADGSNLWYYNGKFHREDGPAVTRADGTKLWYYNGKFHREDGPAVTWDDGSTEWYQHGRRHREDGPAVVKADGTEEYWIHGKQVNKEDLP